MLRRLAITAALFAAFPLGAQTPPGRAPLAGIDAYIARAMRDWRVPGLAIGIVRDDSVIYMKGFGTRTEEANEPVDAHTIFAIGSSTKAFTATLAAMMVDAGAMRWDDPAIRYLPGFALYDPRVTNELTLRDLLAHRTGLARGDVMWYDGGYDRQEVLRRARFLEPICLPRAQFDYQNIMYLAAGEATARAAGTSWDDLVRERLFEPLGMRESSTSIDALEGMTNVATPHLVSRDSVYVLPWHDVDNMGPAASINSNVADLAKWLRFQLDAGVTNGKRLVSSAALAELRTPQTPVPLAAEAKAFNPYTRREAYGMGWFVQDYRGRELDQHGGDVDGMTAMVAMVPHERLGVVILTNANASPLPTLLLYRVLDAVFGAPPRDWSADGLRLLDESNVLAQTAAQRRSATRVRHTKPTLPVAQYAGVYTDSLFGDVTFTVAHDTLSMRYGTGIRARLAHWQYDTFQAVSRERTVGTLMTTFYVGPDGEVKSVEIEGVGTFVRKQDAGFGM